MRLRLRQSERPLRLRRIQQRRPRTIACPRIAPAPIRSLSFLRSPFGHFFQFLHLGQPVAIVPSVSELLPRGDLRLQRQVPLRVVGVDVRPIVQHLIVRPNQARGAVAVGVVGVAFAVIRARAPNRIAGPHELVAIVVCIARHPIHQRIDPRDPPRRIVEIPITGQLLARRIVILGIVGMRQPRQPPLRVIVKMRGRHVLIVGQVRKPGNLLEPPIRVVREIHPLFRYGVAWGLAILPNHSQPVLIVVRVCVLEIHRRADGRLQQVAIPRQVVAPFVLDLRRQTRDRLRFRRQAANGVILIGIICRGIARTCELACRVVQVFRGFHRVPRAVQPDFCRVPPHDVVFIFRHPSQAVRLFGQIARCVVGKQPAIPERIRFAHRAEQMVVLPGRRVLVGIGQRQHVAGQVVRELRLPP